MSDRHSYVSDFCYNEATLDRVIAAIRDSWCAEGAWAPQKVGNGLVVGIHKNLHGGSDDWDNVMGEVAEALEPGDVITIVSIFESGEVKQYKFDGKTVTASVLVPPKTLEEYGIKPHVFAPPPQRSIVIPLPKHEDSAR